MQVLLKAVYDGTPGLRRHISDVCEREGLDKNELVSLLTTRYVEGGAMWTHIAFRAV